MLIRKAYKFRLKPTEDQEALLNAYAGHTRFLWNKALSLNLARLKNKQPIMYYQELDYWSKLWKKSDEYGFLRECPAHIVQQKLRDLEKAFRDCFDKNQPNKRLPKFKKRNSGDGFRFPEPKHIKLEKRHISLPKLGRMRFYDSCEIIGTVKNCTVSRSGNHWYIAVQVELELDRIKILENTREITSSIGIDVGIKHFVSTSDGEQKMPLNAYRKLEKLLAKAQRKLAKKIRFSANWKKMQKRIRKIHCKIANLRRDFLHKLSTKLSKSHALIVVEKLKVKNMSKSAKGSNVAAKSGLNKSILDQGWSEFKRQLGYKLDWHGGMLLEVDPRYTSQECSNCNHIDAKSRKTQEIFECTKCSYQINADINAAKNILAAGLGRVGL